MIKKVVIGAAIAVGIAFSAYTYNEVDKVVQESVSSNTVHLGLCATYLYLHNGNEGQFKEHLDLLKMPEEVEMDVIEIAGLTHINRSLEKALKGINSNNVAMELFLEEGCGAVYI